MGSTGMARRQGLYRLSGWRRRPGQNFSRTEDVKAYTDKVIVALPRICHSGLRLINPPLGTELQTSWNQKISKVLKEGPFAISFLSGSKTFGSTEWLPLVNSGTNGKLHLKGPGTHGGCALITKAEVSQLTNREAYPIYDNLSLHRSIRPREDRQSPKRIRTLRRGYRSGRPIKTRPPPGRKILVSSGSMVGQKVSAGAALSSWRSMAQQATATPSAHLWPAS